MAVLPDIFNSQPTAWVYGFGCGQFKGGREMEVPKFAKEYEWFLQGTWIGITMFGIEMGTLGVLWYAMYTIVLFRMMTKARQREKRVQTYIFFIMATSLLYGPNFIYLVYTFIITYIAFVGGRWKLTVIADKE